MSRGHTPVEAVGWSWVGACFPVETPGWVGGGSYVLVETLGGISVVGCVPIEASGGLLSCGTVKGGVEPVGLSSPVKASVGGLVYNIQNQHNNTTQVGGVPGGGLVAASKGAGSWLEPAPANSGWLGHASVCGGKLVGGWLERAPVVRVGGI